MKRPNRIEYDFNDKFESVRFAYDMIRYADYLEEKCKLAEKCLEVSPCDPDITDEQIEAHKAYNDFIEKHSQTPKP